MTHVVIDATGLVGLAFVTGFYLAVASVCRICREVSEGHLRRSPAFRYALAFCFGILGGIAAIIVLGVMLLVPLLMFA